MPNQSSDPVIDGKAGFVQDFRRFFVRGLVLVLPPFLTVFLLFYGWYFLDRYVAQPLNSGARYGVAWFIAESRSLPPAGLESHWTKLEPRGPYVPADVHKLVVSKVQPKEMPRKVVDLYERYIYFEYYQDWELAFRVFGLFVAAVVIYFIGHFLATFIGRSVWHAVEYTVFRLPVVRAVYPYVKQFIDVVLSERKREYNRVVMVEYPRRGLWSLGLVTGEGLGELERATGQEFLTVFIPYTPYSVTGYIITVPRSEVLDLALSVDEAIRYVVSGGVIRPSLAPLPVAAQAAITRESTPATVTGPGAVHQRRPRTASDGPLRVGTRGSQLARVQSEWVVARLRELAPDRELELVEIKTSGDRSPDAKLSEIAGEGLFTKEIQRALCDGEVDIAVHSLKDLPTVSVAGLVLAAVPPRAPALDVLVAPNVSDWRSLPAGARLGTSSPRRRSQLLRLRNDLTIVDLRGNVPTRLRKIEELGLAGIVLAHAGLHRLGLEQHITYRFTPDELLPAPGQGALGIECREEDHEITELLSRLDDLATRQATAAERAVLATLEGGCHVPLGTYATVADGQIELRAVVVSPDGARTLSERIGGPAIVAESLGARLAERLLAAGAKELL